EPCPGRARPDGTSSDGATTARNRRAHRGHNDQKHSRAPTIIKVGRAGAQTRRPPPEMNSGNEKRRIGTQTQGVPNTGTRPRSAGDTERRPAMNDSRRAQVLRAIVEDFVATNEPVGSKAIVQRHTLGVSPATIRNDMAQLEHEGYIAQPHT